MASNVMRAKLTTISKTLITVRPAGAFYSHSQNHWVPYSSTAAAAAVHDKEKGSKWSRWFLFLPGAITFGLGTWQIFRRQDKVFFVCCSYIYGFQ